MEKSLKQSPLPPFLRQIRRSLLFFDRYRYPRLGRALASLLAEPKAFVKTVFYYPFGRFQFNSLKINGPAILLLHGNHHNPSAFFGLSRYLKKEKGIGPLFTVALPSGEITENDISRVEEKLAHIRSLYEKEGIPFSFSIVAHSRGAEVAARFLSHPNLSKVVALGTPISTLFTPENQEKLFEIDALRDVLVLERSTGPNQADFNLGHLGLLHCPKVFQKIHSWLK